MIFLTWWKKACDWFWGCVYDGTDQEGAELQADLDRLDNEQPGWDRDSRVARAQWCLNDGSLSREAAVQVYGEEIVAEAERLNEKERKPQQ